MLSQTQSPFSNLVSFSRVCFTMTVTCSDAVASYSCPVLSAQLLNHI